MNNLGSVTFWLIYIFMILIVLTPLIISLVIGNWNLFKKAGKPGWASIVPIYSTYCSFEIAMGHGWYFLLLCIPFVNIYIKIKQSMCLARAFGKGIAFGMGLLFIPFVFIPVIGIGDLKYLGPQ